MRQHQRRESCRESRGDNLHYGELATLPFFLGRSMLAPNQHRPASSLVSCPLWMWEGWTRWRETYVGSEMSEWGLQKREEERRVEAEELGAGEELPLFLHTPSFMASTDGE